MTKFSKGVLPERLRYIALPTSTEDSFSVLVRIMPDLLRFCIVCLASKIELVQMSALKILKFIFETQGCSLDYSMVFILKSVLATFPKPRAETQVLSYGQFYRDLLKSDQDPILYLFKEGTLKCGKDLYDEPTCILTKGQT